MTVREPKGDDIERSGLAVATSLIRMRWLTLSLAAAIFHSSYTVLIEFFEGFEKWIMIGSI